VSLGGKVFATARKVKSKGARQTATE